ncbi:S8 family peptidase [Actinoplanes sp. NPDC051411]|uniref:S8 family peptidase n=1 Tax=Actinoplanes sp. NPDC051411 TaxID=3155522 RepID=UPI00342D478B
MRIDTGRIAALLAGAAAAVICGTPVAAQAAPATGTILGAGSAGAIGNSYIVVLKPGPAGVGAVSRTLTKTYGGEVADDYQATVRGFSVTMTAPQARRLAADPAVRYVEQDATVTLTGSTPAWGLDRIDQRQPALSKTYAAPSAAGVTAYVLDTGIRITHQQFGGRATNGYDAVDRDNVSQDCNGHGTHVAGTIGGSTWGVAKDVKLVAVRVLGCDGSGSYSHIIAGIDWVTQHAHRPAVANMSLGGTVSKALDDAVNRSIAAGVTYAVAAGNDKRDACRQSPADDPAAITVGATDDRDRRASFSNYGRCLDLFAPGVRIESASNRSNTATMIMNGTSMASPHVAGAAALVLGAHPNWTPAQVRDELVTQATPGAVTSPGKGSPTKLLYTGFLNPQAGATSHR